MLTGIFCVLLFAAMIFSPKAVFSGAESGLLLWFQIVFPTLFPFMLVSDLLLEGKGLDLIASFFGKAAGKIFGVSENGSFAVIAGFLCGYPMGAKTAAGLVRLGKISVEEGQYLLSFCNNTSPVFIMNFIVWKTLGRDDLLLPTLGIITGVPVALSFLFRRKSGAGTEKSFCLRAAGPAPETDSRHPLFDTAMMNSFEGIVKVGGYIIFFSVLLEVLKILPGQSPLIMWLAPSLEMTNGILMIHELAPDIRKSYPLIVGLTSFGGICSVAQTNSMIKNTGLSIIPYMKQKLAAAAAASLLAYIFIQFR